ncbi:hypothetical protein [Massilia sp. Se16.2.3]|uniref:hypothetical protein n=1 Tax=Massilia sp. Se16.2.3 TaxID=2709303 RepID=UPI001E5DE302|nr:hypothetical protein [Massilia sp. Se16.2.3]
MASANAPLRSRHGLTILPDLEAGAADAPEMLDASALAVSPGQAPARALDALAGRYGRQTARLVALEFEYPQYR